ncbi:MAG TPA: LUD domain-containing protein [Thermoleophilaceae bacterium]|nr:LUD domain-containing protein [Thermoleophilaceae bacterium]
MSEARDEILRRVRTATRDVGEGPEAWDPDADAAYDRAPSAGDDPAGLLAQRVEDFKATVTRVGGEEEVAAAVAAIAGRHGARRLAVARGFEPGWRPQEGLEFVEEPELSVEELDAVDGVVTGCALAIAATGTIVLDGGPGQGPRRLTLVPDLHVCVVREDQIVPGVPQAVAALKDAAVSGRPLTFVSGPSATSDIELDRVEGVHGPRRLEVVLVA